MGKSNKPLKDWTIGEAKKYCRNHSCGPECKIMRKGAYCRLSCVPSCWYLKEESKYTADEIIMAKMLVEAGAAIVVRNSEWLVQLGNSVSDKAWCLPAKAFPSLKVGQTVDLKDIAESGAQDETD